MGDLDCEGRGGIHNVYSGGTIDVHLQIVILIGVIAVAVAPAAAAFTASEFTATHEAEYVMAKVRRGQNLDGGEDVVEAGEQHEDDPVGLAQHLLVLCDDVVADAEQEELHGPRDEVAECRDGILAALCALGQRAIFDKCK